MPEADLVVFDTSVSISDPLSLRVLRCPLDSFLSVIVIGPLGAVELQIRFSELEQRYGGGMSLAYHSRQPAFGLEDGRPNCPVLDGARCFLDGITGSTQATFEPWFRTRDGQAVVDELVRRYQTISWTHDDEDLAAAIVPEPAGQPPAAEKVPPWA